ncbi:hypothetical protein [Novosphingopyxis sp.]|uniref:hypothetical protein n=1 Tax=Novosphingopyxis sp. TaxID=2709690 RepID=UPI003B5B30EC
MEEKVQQQISNVLARRSASAQANFLLPHLKVGIAVLDCGCGPGTITCDLARKRVLAPGGILALRSPDWGGILIAPRTPALLAAIGTFLSVHYNNGDAFAGSNGPGLANMGGFSDIVFSASVEREHPAELGPFAAGKLTASLCAAEIACLLTWANDPKALFAQTWGEVVARRAD